MAWYAVESGPLGLGATGGSCTTGALGSAGVLDAASCGAGSWAAGRSGTTGHAAGVRGNGGRIGICEPGVADRRVVMLNI